MTQKELTCRGLEGWRHGVRRHVGRTEYYRTTPANSSPKFRWLNGKAPQGQHDGRTDVHFQKMRLDPHILVSIGKSPTSVFHTDPTPLVAFRPSLTSRDGQSTAHGCCVPGFAVPATDLRSASWYSPSRALSRPEIPLFWFICSKTGSPFGSPKLTKASPAAVAKL